MKQAPKWKISNLMAHSIIFTHLFQKLSLYTKWAKIKSILETSTFQIPEIEICKWNRQFSNFTQIYPKLSSISKWEKLKLVQ